MSEQVLKSSPEIRWKTIALPVEHGGWGFLIEPMILGLLVSFSPSGVALCVAALGVFLIHQPLKIALKDRLNSRRYERSRWAERFVIGYALLALLDLTLALIWSETFSWSSLVCAIPFAGIQLIYEARGKGRELLPQVSGALALGAIAPAVAMAGGSTVTSMVLWLLLALRIVPSLVYVRVVLRRMRGKPASAFAPLAAHVVAALILVTLWLVGLVNGLSLVAVFVLLLRAAYRLSKMQAVHARIVGMQEMFFGLLYVLLVAGGTKV